MTKKPANLATRRGHAQRAYWTGATPEPAGDHGVARGTRASRGPRIRVTASSGGSVAAPGAAKCLKRATQLAGLEMTLPAESTISIWVPCRAGSVHEQGPSGE